MTSTFHITGVTTNGKRFRIVTKNAIHAMSINLYKGSVWEVVDGKRKLLKRVYP